MFLIFVLKHIYQSTKNVKHYFNIIVEHGILLIGIEDSKNRKAKQYFREGDASGH